MKAVGSLLALLLLAVSAGWLVMRYLDADETIRHVASRLPSEAEFDAMPPEQSSEEIAAALVDCARLADLDGNPVARALKRDEIDALRRHCALIEARRAASQRR